MTAVPQGNEVDLLRVHVAHLQAITLFQWPASVPQLVPFTTTQNESAISRQIASGIYALHKYRRPHTVHSSKEVSLTFLQLVYQLALTPTDLQTAKNDNFSSFQLAPTGCLPWFEISNLTTEPSGSVQWDKWVSEDLFPSHRLAQTKAPVLARSLYRLIFLGWLGYPFTRTHHR